MTNTTFNTAAWRKRTKQRMVDAFGGCCGICTYKRCLSALEFHHLDPKLKSCSVSRLVNRPKAWHRIVIELRKCVCLCSNCHSEVHAGINIVPSDINRFDESYSEYNVSRPTKIDWSKVDVPALYAEHGTFVAVAKVLGVSDVSVRRWYRKALK